MYFYWWFFENEWWKIYGDGRNFGGKDFVVFILNVLNDEVLFNNISFYSLEDYWLIFIFYGKDTRFNFEFNLGDFDKEGSLNKWIEIMFDNGY